MKFIKASERLPNSDSPQYHFRVDGWNKINGNFFDNENGEAAFSVMGNGCFEDYIIPKEKFSQIEWLDESTPSFTREDMKGFAEWVEDNYVWHEDVCRWKHILNDIIYYTTDQLLDLYLQNIKQ
jgi:hypothetical protein